jgi:uncharacterized lipoprotein YehR (DUF1307 family)
MLKKIVVLAIALILAVSFGACKKKEERPQMPAGHPGMGMEGGMPNMPKIDRTVVVPNDVKAKWKAVKIAIEDKATKSTQQYTVTIGSDVAVPNTNIKIKVLAFLPDFKMNDKEFTSASDKPNNPAAQIVVQEPGKEEWKGWLYSMHPDIHPFTHEKIAITLVGGVAK